MLGGHFMKHESLLASSGSDMLAGKCIALIN
jgi:hypothetical protein